MLPRSPVPPSFRIALEPHSQANRRRVAFVHRVDQDGARPADPVLTAEGSVPVRPAKILAGMASASVLRGWTSIS